MHSKNFRGAIIGCGFFAQNHLHSWRDVNGAELVAACDTDANKVIEAAKNFGIPRHYTDTKQMFKEESLDFVDVVTTMPTHRSLVELAASHGVPVICQKPFAPTVEDARAMVKACEKASVPLMVHENFRWQSPLMAVKKVLSSQLIGEPFFGRVSFRTAHDIYTNQPYLAEEKRFMLLDLGVHLLDVARFLFGEVTHLFCRTASANPIVKAEDTATILVTQENGVACVVDGCYFSHQDPDPFPQTLIEVDGTQGTIRLDRGYRMTVVGPDGTEIQDVEPRLLPWASKPWHGIQESVFNIQQHWVDCLRDGRQPDTSGVDNLKTFLLAEAAYESHKSGLAIQF